MKAYEINEFGIDQLKLIEKDVPEPADDEVLVRIKAASLNYRDVMVVTGTYNPRMKFPAVPLSDGAGEITALGKNVTKWKVGDRVMPIFAQRWYDGVTDEDKRRSSLGGGAEWDGVLREYATFNEQSVLRIPDHLSYNEAATLPCAAVTAWNALAVSGNIKAGDTVLTLGTGGVSIFAIQIAKAFGARVIATSSSDEKIAKLKSMGVDETINYNTRDDWDRAVIEMTEKKGVDHVVEVGGAGTLGKSINSVRLGGHIAMIGALTGAGNFNPVSVFMKAVRLQGIFVGSRSIFEDLLKAISVNQIKPLVDRVFEFNEARDALKYMESGSHFGKIVISI